MQTKHIEGDAIAFGPTEGSLAGLQDTERLVASLLANPAYQRYSIDDWSLGVRLESYVCMPANSGQHEIDFQVQVCSNRAVHRLVRLRDLLTNSVICSAASVRACNADLQSVSTCLQRQACP